MIPKNTEMIGTFQVYRVRAAWSAQLQRGPE
jgi:hypothetical protein